VEPGCSGRREEKMTIKIEMKKKGVGGKRKSKQKKG